MGKSKQIATMLTDAPAALDTLDELAAALGDDANFATTVTNSIATKLDISNPVIDMGTNKKIEFSGNIGEVGSVPGFQARNDAGSGLRSMGLRGTSLRFATGSNERLRIDENGNIGIGVTPATTAGVNYARLVIDADSSNYPKSLEINATNAAGPNFSISSYSDNNGSYYLLGANLQLQSNGNFAWETNGEHMAGISIDSRAGHGVTFVDSYYDSNTTAYVPAEIGKVHTSIDGRADITVDATGLAGDGGVNANAFFNAKAKGYYYAGLDIKSNDGHVGGWIGHHNGSDTARNIQARVGGTGINASDYLAIKADYLGRVTKPNTPAFMAKGNNANYITTSPIPFPTVEFNVGNHYNASNYTFTAPVSGRYFFHAHIGLVNGGSGNQIYPWFSVNGAQVMYSYNNFSTTFYSNSPLTCIFNLSANDTVAVTLSYSGATYYNHQAETRFMGYLLG